MCARFDNYEKRSNFHIFKWIRTATASGIPNSMLYHTIKYIWYICKFLIHFCAEWFSISVYQSHWHWSLSHFCPRLSASLSLFISVLTANGKIGAALFVPRRPAIFQVIILRSRCASAAANRPSVSTCAHRPPPPPFSSPSHSCCEWCRIHKQTHTQTPTVLFAQIEISQSK